MSNQLVKAVQFIFDIIDIDDLNEEQKELFESLKYDLDSLNIDDEDLELEDDDEDLELEDDEDLELEDDEDLELEDDEDLELEDDEDLKEITSQDMSNILSGIQNYVPWGDLSFKKMEPGLKKMGVVVKEGAGHYKLDRKLKDGKIKTISIPRNEVNTKTALRILDDLDIDKKEYFTKYYKKPSKEQKAQMKKEKAE